jgi:hypothetical protein
MIRHTIFALAACVALAARAAEPSNIAKLASEWAEAQATQSLAKGVPLTRAQQSMAQSVGVLHPSRVRLLLVDELPAPDHPALVAAAGRIGLMPQAADGMTLGYAVLIRRDAENDEKLLRHELRHVAQYESRGGIGPFLAEHIPALLRYGYAASPFERDARAHETATAAR